MLGNLEIALIAGAAVLLFGADRLPKLGRSFGEMRKEFVRGNHEGEADATSPSAQAIATVPETPAPVDAAHPPLAKEAERPQP